MQAPTKTRLQFAASRAAVGAIVLLAGLIFVSQATAKPAADDWRRTAHGWERSSDWPKIARHRIEARQLQPLAAIHSTARIDVHPAALALFQLTASLLVLAASRAGATANATSPSLGTLVARSFRASAFGS